MVLSNDHHRMMSFTVKQGTLITRDILWDTGLVSVKVTWDCWYAFIYPESPKLSRKSAKPKLFVWVGNVNSHETCEVSYTLLIVTCSSHYAIFKILNIICNFAEIIVIVISLRKIKDSALICKNYKLPELVEMIITCKGTYIIRLLWFVHLLLASALHCWHAAPFFADRFNMQW